MSAFIGLRNEFDTVTVALEDLERTVGRDGILDDEFDIAVGLTNYAVNGTPDLRRPISHEHEDRHERQAVSAARTVIAVGRFHCAPCRSRQRVKKRLPSVATRWRQ